MNDDEDEEAWTITSLYPASRGGRADEGLMPPADDVVRLVSELREYWSDASQRDASLQSLLTWIGNKLGYDLTGRDFTSEDFATFIDAELVRVQRLQDYMNEHRLEDPLLVETLRESARAIHAVRLLVHHAGLVVFQLQPLDPGRSKFLDASLHSDASRIDVLESVFEQNAKDLTAWQRAFQMICERLKGREYRRADGKLYQRVVTRSGLETFAFREAITIRRFLLEQQSASRQYKLWKEVTRDAVSLDRMEKYMASAPLDDAPDLLVHRHLRSYEGDAVGRGAGIYDGNADMFFEYLRRDQWDDMANNMTLLRRRWQPDYVCRAPAPTDVCVLHLEGAFPYDIFSEERANRAAVTRWREVEAHDVRRMERMDAPPLAQHLSAEFGDAGLQRRPARVGRSWLLTQCAIPEDWRRLTPADSFIAAALVSKGQDLFDDEALEVEALHECTYVNDEERGGAWVPCTEPSMTPTVSLEVGRVHELGGDMSAALRSFVAFVVPGGATRYFRLRTGRAWGECDVPELDQMYVHQRFNASDRHMLYAGKGRLFWEVRERDKYEWTLMLQGIGGCGKSTIMRVQQAFWPHHLRGILSANVEPLFGMSRVIESNVIFCNEVSGELNIVQEEWQSSVSGELGSYAVKFKEPIVVACKAQHMWCGNSFPTRFKNDQMQVSRRLAGVRMNEPVTLRDGTLYDRILEQRMGALQRKEVLAYFELLEMYGPNDPMGLPKELPPAFQEFWRAGREHGDPIESFLTDGKYVQHDKTSSLSMAEFKAQYDRYRADNNIGKAIRWSADVYRNAFNERGIRVKHFASYTTSDGQSHVNAEIVLHMRLVGTPQT